LNSVTPPPFTLNIHNNLVFAGKRWDPERVILVTQNKGDKLPAAVSRGSSLDGSRYPAPLPAGDTKSASYPQVPPPPPDPPTPNPPPLPHTYLSKDPAHLCACFPVLLVVDFCYQVPQLSYAWSQRRHAPCIELSCKVSLPLELCCLPPRFLHNSQEDARQQHRNDTFGVLEMDLICGTPSLPGCVDWNFQGMYELAGGAAGGSLVEV